jgi:hypothetical protein
VEYNSKGQRLISVVRVIEYRGTDEWISKVAMASRVPWQGEFKPVDPKTHQPVPLPEGHSIKSGLVNWDIVKEIYEEPEVPTIPIPPGSSVM